jgi:hypothetical protein
LKIEIQKPKNLKRYLQSLELRAQAFKGAVDEKSLSLENTQPTDVFIYEPVAKMMMSSPISGILQKNGPYPRALLPYKVDRRYFKLTFKTVTAREFETINLRIQQKFQAIQAQLVEAGALPAQLLAPGTADPSMQVVEDLVFRTVRRELGMRTKRVPVWIPSIKEFLDGKLDFLENDQLKKIMGDPSYTAWNTLGKVQESESSDIIKKVKEFQDKILSRV